MEPISVDSILSNRSACRHPNSSLTEGPWDEVTRAIRDCHAAVHAQGAPRIATDIRIGTRTDRVIAPGSGNAGKVQRVEDILAEKK
jgi:uncharacterized protein YqgV (UPF0045/DUF77 family)